MLYGLIVGISCIAALLLVSTIYSYSALQARASGLVHAYTTIVRLEAFQRALSGYQNATQQVEQAASIDQISINGSQGTFVIRSKGDSALYSIA